MALKYEFFNGGPDPEVKRDLPIQSKNLGDTATEIDANMRKAGWGGLFSSDQQRDHCKFLEDNVKRNYSCGGKWKLKSHMIEHLMKPYL